MILRIVIGRLPADVEVDEVLAARARLASAAADIRDLESLIVGTRRASGSPAGHVDAVIATVWHDVETMASLTGPDEQDRFLGARLGLPLAIEGADHYEIIGRTFAALPASTPSLVRVMSVRARPNEELRLMGILRDQQPRLVDLGLVASHIGRRVIGAEVEAVTVGVWPDRGVIRRATGGSDERPLFAHELEPWADRLRLEMYDGIEIVPRLPTATDPPLFIVDDDLRIVDITPGAAAKLGWATEDLVGRSIRELAVPPEGDEAMLVSLLTRTEVVGDARWVVPDAGQTLIRFVARRDVPVPGRHAVLVRRRSEPAPTLTDLDEAVAGAFRRG